MLFRNCQKLSKVSSWHWNLQLWALNNKFPLSKRKIKNFKSDWLTFSNLKLKNGVPTKSSKPVVLWKRQKHLPSGTSRTKYRKPRLIAYNFDIRSYRGSPLSDLCEFIDSYQKTTADIIGGTLITETALRTSLLTGENSHQQVKR